MAEQDHDRTEPATPYKREEARRRGQVAKSLDTNSFIVLGAALASFVIWGPAFIQAGARNFRSLLASAQAQAVTPHYLQLWMADTLGATLTSLAPLLVAVLLGAVLANLAQTGPIFSFHPLRPDPQRLNPAQGFKRIYSVRAVFETIKSVLKLLLFAAVAYTAIVGLVPRLIALTGADPKAYPLEVLNYGESVAFRLLLALLLVALLDLAYARWDYNRRMRMSRREQKEELKRREGDPHVRARRRDLLREAAKRSRSLRRLPEADVLITNPTHLAVALKYERGRSAAPRCLGKGAGETAQHMRHIALRHGVRIIEERLLAQALFAEVEIGALIPASLYEPVARIYAELAAAERRAAQRPAVEVRA
jgi:flagellar biosynthesis protein FlhB